MRLEARIVVKALCIDIADGLSVPALEFVGRVTLAFVVIRIGRQVARIDDGVLERGSMNESLAGADDRDFNRLAVGAGGEGARAV
ncbi:hypothetical protein D3C86_1732930 [compost metagenome]